MLPLCLSNYVLLFNFLQTEMLFCSTVVGLPFLLPPMILTGELVKAWNSCSEVSNYELVLSNLCLIYMFHINLHWSQVINDVLTMPVPSEFIMEIHDHTYIH